MGLFYAICSFQLAQEQHIKYYIIEIIERNAEMHIRSENLLY